MELEFDLGNILWHFWTGSTAVLQCGYCYHNPTMDSKRVEVDEMLSNSSGVYYLYYPYKNKIVSMHTRKVHWV
jgi:hypothetical protein